MKERIRGRFSAPRAVVASAIVLLTLTPTPTLGDDSDCLVCHENIGEAFKASIHGQIKAFEVLDGETGCGSCHGDGAQHMDSGGDATLIGRLGDDEFRETVSDACVTCHRTGMLHDWQGSTHEMSGVGCTDCHQVHAVTDPHRQDPEMCWTCHSDVRAQFQYPSHHPLREGHMKCASCHTPHGGSIGLLRSEERPAELCLSCHTQYAGPFIFEHEPVAEGCEACHTPHGAVANNLLV